MEQKAGGTSVRSSVCLKVVCCSPAGPRAVFPDRDAGPLPVPVPGSAEGPAGGPLLLC